MRFTAEEIRYIEDTILDGRAHTTRNLIAFFAHNEIQERQVDKIIQRLRKAGKIAMKRNGRSIEWTATPSQAVQAA